MTHIRYDVIPQGGGWSIAMGGAVGPPYSDLDRALRDIDSVAKFLAQMGDSVEIVIWRDGEPTLFERVEPLQSGASRAGNRAPASHREFTSHLP